MRIAYRTTDEVNLDLALRLAAGAAAIVDVLWPKDPPGDGRFDAVLYDLDCLSPPHRQELVAALLAGRAHWQVAVHGYGLEESQVRGLRSRGVIASACLNQGLFEEWRRAVARNDAAATPSRNGTDRQMLAVPR